jgi:hypothetical protein
VKSDKVIFLSCTSAGVICIKIASILFYKIRSFIILHSVIETIDKKKILPIWDFPFNLIYTLGILNNKKIKFILLNDFSLIRLKKQYPKFIPFFLAIEFPFEYESNVALNHNSINNVEKVVFASIGDYNERKNSSYFFDLAKQVCEMNSSFDFWFIGRFDAENIDIKNVNLVSSKHKLDDENYHHFINLIDYAVFLFNDEFYRYSVSGTLYDAIYHLKPIVAIRTPFFEDYFLKYGNIGYLCDTYDDMLILMTTSDLKKNNDVYMEQQTNLLKARRDLNDNFFNSLSIFSNQIN